MSFEPLFHEVWQRGQKPDEIVGFWAEDFTPYTITVPHQLRDLIIQWHNEKFVEYKNSQNQKWGKLLQEES